MSRAGTKRTRRPFRRRPCRPCPTAGALLLGTVAAVAGCGPRDAPPDLAADSVLRRELGLTDADRVHRILLTSGDREEIRPDSVAVRPGDWLEFVSGDFRVREVRFDRDRLEPGPRDFLSATDQMESPPLVARDARFVVFFAEAPPGRYPFRVEGNLPASSGVVVVVSPP